MDDYISRQTAMDCLTGIYEDPVSLHEYITVTLRKLRNAPSADVQPVVRCKNCKYWDESDIHSTVNPNCRCRAVVRKNYTDSEFYCAYGERKDGEQSGAD